VCAEGEKVKWRKLEKSSQVKWIVNLFLSFSPFSFVSWASASGHSAAEGESLTSYSLTCCLGLRE